ncbi:NAD(P)/FAD-dependent oxidoreductase [Sabulicella glaciei]|uniref:FAD-dependent oxidoreductase n=1 Tax=Sabulicella glaciei TaxID=2984948 RepID=A0ABT3NT02_9PROT|nr:FAD-dependent oxidoreductase [Roseococcus sp. MDT2-1-1]MCW8084684.1 FAD-dependent oxidoreductase [Roseococcus sp. MDT2-1-1]
MLRLTELRLPLDHPPEALDAAVAERLGAAPTRYSVFRRGYDARNPRRIMLAYTVDAEVRDETDLLARDPRLRPSPDMTYRFVAEAPEGLADRPVVVGTGPCGLMAALILAQSGFRPIILERGKAVRERTQDTWGLWRRQVLNPESNVQFGEGGAGTFSDGKLWSQIRDPFFFGRKLLKEFVKAGAPEEILFISKPHIGTFRLVQMVERIRSEITALGGEYRFGQRVDDIETDPGTRAIRALHLSTGERLEARHVILAIGHSARDSFAMLHGRGVQMEAKPFSVGVRIEHPQSLINLRRFGPNAGNMLLGAADYRLVHHASNGRGVYSFCMCPGGRVVAAASEAGRLVTNGMSQYQRDERNANAGIVVGINPEDYPGGPLAGIEFQRRWEERAFEAGGRNYRAPAQRVGDFLAGRASTTLGEVAPSYQPGVTPADLAPCLPDFAVAAMREALAAFDRDLPGFAMGDAVMTGVETRTSSPLRIPRGEDCQSLNTPGLYPAGEGAGYAGGIFSAGVDGIRVAEAVALAMTGGGPVRSSGRPKDDSVTYG